VEAGKKAAGEVLALQKRVLAVLNEARLLFVFHFFLIYTKGKEGCLFLDHSSHDYLFFFFHNF
jgi:hypothetical protein